MQSNFRDFLLHRAGCHFIAIQRLIIACVLFIGAVSANAAGNDFELKEIRDNVYWISDGAYNTLFLVTNDGVVAIDPLPSLGKRYMTAIAKVTDKPVTFIIYSHDHADHIGGAYLFPKSAKIIAQAETAAALIRAHDPHRPVPTIVFDKDYVLETGGQRIELKYTGVNHDAGNSFIYFPAQKVLMLVDVIYPGYVPYPNLGVATDIAGYISVHRDALKYEFTEFVGGHVDRIGTRKDVESSYEFVQDLASTAREVLSDRSFPSFLQAIKTTTKEGTWFSHDDYEKDRVEACFEKMYVKWATRLLGVDRSLRSHCWSMIVAMAISPPEIKIPPM